MFAADTVTLSLVWFVPLVVLAVFGVVMLLGRFR